jgi:hypothetical protein
MTGPNRLGALARVARRPNVRLRVACAQASGQLGRQARQGRQRDVARRLAAHLAPSWRSRRMRARSAAVVPA